MRESRSQAIALTTAVISALDCWRDVSGRPREDQIWRFAARMSSMVAQIAPRTPLNSTEYPESRMRQGYLLQAGAMLVTAAKCWRDLARSQQSYESRLRKWRTGEREEPADGSADLALLASAVAAASGYVSARKMVSQGSAGSTWEQWGSRVTLVVPPVAYGFRQVVPRPRVKPRLVPILLGNLLLALMSTSWSLTNLLAGLESRRAFDRRRNKQDSWMARTGAS